MRKVDTVVRGHSHQPRKHQRAKKGKDNILQKTYYFHNFCYIFLSCYHNNILYLNIARKKKREKIQLFNHKTPRKTMFQFFEFLFRLPGGFFLLLSPPSFCVLVVVTGSCGNLTWL